MDKPLLKDIEKKWLLWLTSLVDALTVPISLMRQNQKTHGIELHGFGDASKEGCYSAFYAAVKQSKETTIGLLTEIHPHLI